MEGERDSEPQPQREHFRPLLKIFFLVSLSVSLCYLVIASPNDILRSKGQFQAWYPQFGSAFAAIVENNCSVAYDTYRYGTRQNTTADSLRGRETITLFVEPMINCILGNSSEYIKYALSSSQVMLGLTPTIIAILGASSEEVCLLALIGRRRFLALLLAAASPSIFTTRSFEYRTPSEILKVRLNMKHVDSTLEIKKRIIIIIIEYVVALGALANTATVSWQLGVKTISSTNPSNTLTPTLWFLLAIPAHIAGAIIFRLIAIRVEYPGEDHSESRGAFKFWKLSVWTSWLKGFYTGLKGHHRNPGSTLSHWGTAYWNIIRREFCLHLKQGQREKIYIKWFEESRLFTISAWFLSVLIVFHIILGTLILSGTTFIGPRDALGVMMRYIASVVACRVILLYELAVMRACYKNGGNDESRHSNQEGVLRSEFGQKGENYSSVQTIGG
jgi:hypothetical protein